MNSIKSQELSLKLSLEERIFFASQMGTLGGHLMGKAAQGCPLPPEKTLDISLLMILLTEEITLGYLKPYE